MTEHDSPPAPASAAAQAPALRIADLSGGGSGWQGWFDRVMPPDTPWQDSGIATPAGLGGLAGGGRVVVIYDAARHVLESALRQGNPPGQAITAWQETAQAILRHYRRHRRRTFLAEAAAFSAAPQLLAERLAAWSGTALRIPPAGPEPAPGTGDGPDALHAVAAGLALSVPAVRQLADELEAGGFGLQPDADPTPEALDLFFEKLAQEARIRPLEAAQATAAEEADLLRQQLVAVQEMLEQEHRLRRALEEDALARQNDERQALERELHESRAEIERLMRSRSMRLTAPLRAARGLISRSGADDG